MGKNSAYHNMEIPRGVYGELSKIKEEIYELIDADNQEDLILYYCELSDIFGALEGYIQKYFDPEVDLVRLCHDNESSDGKYPYVFKPEDLLKNFNSTLGNVEHPTMEDVNDFIVYFVIGVMSDMVNIHSLVDFEDLKKFSDKTKMSKNL